jgi:WD40 repeat protein
LDGSLSIRDVLTGREIQRLLKAPVASKLNRLGGKPLEFDLADGVFRAFSPADKLLVVRGPHRTLTIWDVAADRDVRRVAGPAPVRVAGRAADERSAPSIAFAPDGKTYAASDKHGARLWDVLTGREIRRFPRSNQPARSLSFAPNGKNLAGVYGHSVLLWDIATGREREKLDHAQVVRVVAFAPGGETLATGDSIGCLCLWRVATGRKRGEFCDGRPSVPERAGITSLVFLPDGKTVAAGADDFFVQLCDMTTGQIRRRLAGHTNSVFSVAIAPDGKTLATASRDGTTLVWDATMICKD